MIPAFKIIWKDSTNIGIRPNKRKCSRINKYYYVVVTICHVFLLNNIGIIMIRLIRMSWNSVVVRNTVCFDVNYIFCTFVNGRDCIGWVKIGDF